MNQQFGDKIPYRIRADFCSANLATVQQIGPNTFHLWVQSDAPGIDMEKRYRCWFYFCIEGGQRGNTVSFTLKNMNKHSRLYRAGMKPQVRSLPSCPVWNRISQPMRFQETDDFLELTFKHTFEFSDEEVYFAFNYPFSFEDIQNQIARVALWCRLPSIAQFIYFHQECIVQSLDGRPVDLLTITSPLGLTSDREPFIPSLFPFRDTEPRSHIFADKKIIFVSARVHPGETPAQHVFNGFLEFILSDDERAVLLRDRFVFKVIPCLNPDGVSRGHYRSDSRCCNLNRYYTDPQLALHPTIFASKQLMLQWNQSKQVAFFIDVHAHANKKGLFLYGNSLHGPEQVETVLFAKLLHLNNPHFDFEGSNFSESIMKAKDKRGESREGSARVSMHLATGLTHCYTLECNYHMSAAVHACPPLPASTSASAVARKFSSKNIQDPPHMISALWRLCSPASPSSPPHEPSYRPPTVDALLESHSSAAVSSHSHAPPLFNVMYTLAPYFDPRLDVHPQLEYDVPKYMAMGTSVAIAIADMVEINSQSRLIRSEFKSVEGLHAFIKRYLLEKDPRADVGQLRPASSIHSTLVSSTAFALSMNSDYFGQPPSGNPLSSPQTALPVPGSSLQGPIKSSATASKPISKSSAPVSASQNGHSVQASNAEANSAAPSKAPTPRQPSQLGSAQRASPVMQASTARLKTASQPASQAAVRSRISISTSSISAPPEATAAISALPPRSHAAAASSRKLPVIAPSVSSTKSVDSLQISAASMFAMPSHPALSQASVSRHLNQHAAPSLIPAPRVQSRSGPGSNSNSAQSADSLADALSSFGLRGSKLRPPSAHISF